MKPPTSSEQRAAYDSLAAKNPFAAAQYGAQHPEIYSDAEPSTPIPAPPPPPPPPAAAPELDPFAAARARLEPKPLVPIERPTTEQVAAMDPFTAAMTRLAHGLYEAEASK